MPVTVAKEILDEVRGTYLNDVNATEATDDILLPKLRTAYSMLECELESNGLQCISEEIVKVIKAGDNEFELPPDLVMPNTMLERQPNTTDRYREMTYRANIPTLPPGPFLEYWTYRAERIFVLASAQDREAKLIYQRAFPVVETADAAIFGKAEDYLAAKTAALYLTFVRQSLTLAKEAGDIAKDQLADIINRQVKGSQAEPVRRKGYLPFRVR